MASTVLEAMKYCGAVKDRFELDRPEKYTQLIRILRYHHSGRMDTADVVANVEELLRGHHDLIFGFNDYFLPEGVAIEARLPPRPAGHDFDFGFGASITFIGEVKRRFRARQAHVFYKFIDILAMVPLRENATYTDLFLEVADLFRDHQDLICRFVDYQHC